MKEIPNLFKAISQTIQETRLETGISQRELAKKMECARSFIASIEGSQNQLSINTLFVMADALSIQPEELIKRIKAKLLMLDSTPTRSRKTTSRIK